MLKKKLSEFNEVFDKFDKTWAIVTAGDRTNGFNGMTVSWGGVGVLWNKPVCFVFIRHSRHTFDFIEKSDSVSVSFLDEKYRNALTIFGKESGRDVNKFEKANLHPALDVDMNEYYIAEAHQVLKCKKIYGIDLDTENMPKDIKEKIYSTNDIHRMYVLEIKQYLDDEE